MMHKGVGMILLSAVLTFPNVAQGPQLSIEVGTKLTPMDRFPIDFGGHGGFGQNIYEKPKASAAFSASVVVRGVITATLDAIPTKARYVMTSDCCPYTERLRAK